MKWGLLALVFAISVVVLAFGACTPPSAFSEGDARKLAENTVRNEATFAFDGMPETLRLVSTKALGDDSWVFTYEYDSRHAGYGDRTGQILAQVLTPHRAVVTVEQGKVTGAVLDASWDMLNQCSTGT